MEFPWQEAVDVLPEKHELTSVQQRIAYAHVCALLSIGQELSRVNENESPFTEYVTSALGAIAEAAKSA
jgi:hypothetical protein